MAFQLAVAASISKLLGPDNVLLKSFVQTAAPTVKPTAVGSTRRFLRGPEPVKVIHFFEGFPLPSSQPSGQPSFSPSAFRRVSIIYEVAFIIQLFGITDADQAYAVTTTALTTAVQSGQFENRLHNKSLSIPDAVQLSRASVKRTIKIFNKRVTVARSAAPTSSPVKRPEDLIFGMTVTQFTIIISIVGTFAVICCLVGVVFAVRTKCFRREDPIRQRQMPPKSISIFKRFKREKKNTKKNGGKTSGVSTEKASKKKTTRTEDENSAPTRTGKMKSLGKKNKKSSKTKKSHVDSDDENDPPNRDSDEGSVDRGRNKKSVSKKEPRAPKSPAPELDDVYSPSKVKSILSIPMPAIWSSSAEGNSGGALSESGDKNYIWRKQFKFLETRRVNASLAEKKEKQPKVKVMTSKARQDIAYLNDDDDEQNGRHDDDMAIGIQYREVENVDDLEGNDSKAKKTKKKGKKKKSSA